MNNLEEQSPIFILSFCWRTGSTLLQRSINSSGKALLWGEPHVLSDLSNTIRTLFKLSTDTAWARNQVTQDGWEGSWAPTVQPEISYIEEAARSFLFNAYGASAKDAGASRWGFKEVRPDAASNAQLLRRLYPKAKIIFHYRDPFDTFKSVVKTDFYAQFKDEMQPMKVWNNNAVEVSELLKTGFNGFLISHEDFISGGDKVEALFNYIGIDKTESVSSALSKKTGGTSSGELESVMREKIRRIVKPGMFALSEING